MRALIATWGPGGNLPPLLAAAMLLSRRGHDVTVLGSAETSAAAAELGFPVVRYRRAPEPNTRVAFEAQAEAMMATAAGMDVALDAREVLDELRPDLAVVDCMLPAAIAAARATATPVASLVHFVYGLARSRMAQTGDGWTTDLRALAETHAALGLAAPRDGLEAWEAPELVLVSAPRWLDVEPQAPDHVVHAGPLGVAHSDGQARGRRVLLTFSTTVMEGQTDLVDRACKAVTGLGVEASLTLGPALDPAAIRAPDGVEPLPFADHDRLMPECAAVIDHGGLGTVLRALAHGVPQLVLPLGRDQAFNASRVEALGAGIHLPADASPERIRAALEKLLGDARYAEAAAAAAQRIAAAEPDRTAADAFERIAR